MFSATQVKLSMSAKKTSFFSFSTQPSHGSWYSSMETARPCESSRSERDETAWSTSVWPRTELATLFRLRPLSRFTKVSPYIYIHLFENNTDSVYSQLDESSRILRSFDNHPNRETIKTRLRETC